MNGAFHRCIHILYARADDLFGGWNGGEGESGQHLECNRHRLADCLLSVVHNVTDVTTMLVSRGQSSKLPGWGAHPNLVAR